ncbi:cytochrome P450 4V2 isoform X1 [Leptinotarsa decemlineata]|uniref:cytochrome P450 4V2 isoform X1 n=2 Tax=Leptinotarsa decemlineata TaxID=7539 RepID=UPI003D307EFE
MLPYVLGLLVVIALYSMKYHWSRRKMYAAASKMNGPRTLPLIGNAHSFCCKSEDVLQKITSIIDEYNKDPIRFWLGPNLLVVLKNPIHLEKIMSSSKFAYKHELYEIFEEYVGDGLISASGLKPKYKIHRRIFQPLFDIKFISSILGIMRTQMTICMDKLEEHVDKETLDIHDMIFACAGDIIGEAILGMEMNNQRIGLSQFCRSVVEMLEMAYERLVKVWLQFDFIFNRLPIKKKSDEVIFVIHNFVEEALMVSFERRNSSERDEARFVPIIDTISKFAESNPDIINQEDLVNHLITFFPASADTSTIITSFAAVCFGMYPEYQEKAALEVRSIVGDEISEITLDQIYKMEYLDMCMKDVLRLFPIAPYILRRTVEDYALDKWVLPKGTAIVVPIFNLHRDTAHWENPEHFHPDHFLPEAVKNRHIYAYMPFSAGPRGCIGKTLANIILKMFMANLLHRFEIQADGKVPDLQLKADISTRPKGGYYCRLKKREWKINDTLMK